MCRPQVKSEIQDVKASELHNAVWQHNKRATKFNRKVAEFAQDFIDIGECS